jgi:polyisoprenoid-binding protein YceI
MGLSLAALGLSAPLHFTQNKAQDALKNYEVDTKLSRIYVRVDGEGLGHSHGVVGQLSSGTIALGASEKASTLVFDMTSLVADHPDVRKYVGVEGTMSESNQRSVTRTMLGGQVLNAEEFPKATYTITAVTPLDKQAAGEPGRYQFDGQFTLRGTAKALRFEAKAERGKPDGVLHVRGQFPLKQTDYQIKPYSALFGTVKVKDELRIFGDLLLVPKS